MSEPSPAEAIFFAALEKSTAAARASFLDEACAGDETLRRRVERLLAAHAQVGAFLERPVQEAAGLDALSPQHSTPQAAQSVDAAAPTKRLEDGDRLDFLAPSATTGSLGRLAHYEVLGVVGHGGMGIVLRAFDDKLQRIVALKVMAPQLAGSVSARERFVREGRAAAAVSHDNVLAIYAVEDAGPVPFLVMPFIDGPTLQGKLKPGEPLPIAVVVRLGRDIAAGLAAAHACGLVHRDVKPANILLEGSRQRVKISDFGLARGVDDKGLTHSGFIVGTPEYMSPEQANGQAVDHRSDLFSLGSVLYVLCAGQPPFQAATTLAVLKRVSEDTPQPLRQINPNVPDWLQAVITKLHAKDPAERFQTAAEVVEAFQGHLTPNQVTDPATPVVAALGRRARQKRTRRVVLAVLLLLGLGLLGAGLVASRIDQPTDEARTPDTGNGADPPQPRPPATAEELAKRPSPLDALKREEMPLPDKAPPELLAVLGEPPRFGLPGVGKTHAMAQSADGQLLAVPFGETVVLFEVRTGKRLMMLNGRNGEVDRPAFSPDGKTLWCAGSRRYSWTWEVATGQASTTMDLSAKGLAPGLGAYDPRGGRRVHTESSSRIAVLGPGIPGGVMHVAQHSCAWQDVAYRPDGKQLASVAADGACKLWDADTWMEVRALPNHGQSLEAVAWSRDGTLLAAGNDTEVLVWEADTGRLLHTLATPGRGLLAFSPDSRTLFTARHDCTKGERHAFSRWDVKTGIKQTTCELPSSGSRAYYLLGTDGQSVFVNSDMPEQPRIRDYDAQTGQERFPHSGHISGVISMAFSPDGRTLATGSNDRTARLWDLAEWKGGQRSPPSRTLPGHPNAVGAVVFSPDGAFLASAAFLGSPDWVPRDPPGEERRLFLWETASGRKVHELAGHFAPAPFPAFTPDGVWLAAGDGGRVSLWDVRTGKLDQSSSWSDSTLKAAIFSRDGRLMACADNHTIQVIDRQAGQQRHLFRGDRIFTNLAFSPDGTILAAATHGVQPRLRLWDTATGAEQAARISPGINIWGLAFHPSGRLVATNAWMDNKVRLWDVAPGGKEVHAFEHGDQAGGGIAFSPEGRYLAVGQSMATVRIFRMPPGEPRHE
jgi:WD40 repeat protein